MLKLSDGKTGVFHKKYLIASSHEAGPNSISLPVDFQCTTINT